MWQRGRTEPRRALPSHTEPPRATPSYSEPPGATRSHIEPRIATSSHATQHRATHSHTTKTQSHNDGNQLPPTTTTWLRAALCVHTTTCVTIQRCPDDCHTQPGVFTIQPLSSRPTKPYVFTIQRTSGPTKSRDSNIDVQLHKATETNTISRELIFMIEIVVVVEIEIVIATSTSRSTTPPRLT